MLLKNARALLARRRPDAPGDRQRPGAAWRTPARFAGIAVTTTVLLAVGANAASAASAHFVPEATQVGWDGAEATVSFQEVDVALKGTTTVSVKLTASVSAFCVKGESTIDVHASATGLLATEHPIKDGTVAGVAKFPIVVKIPHDPGYVCLLRNRSITAFLEDFRTGATLVHHQD